MSVNNPFEEERIEPEGRKRRNHMKKRTVKLLSLMMVTTFLATSTITTEAAGTGAYQKIKTGDKISKKESANKGDYVERQALVLYKDNKISTKAAAQRALNVSDISVSLRPAEGPGCSRRNPGRG